MAFENILSTTGEKQILRCTEGSVADFFGWIDRNGTGICTPLVPMSYGNHRRNNLQTEIKQCMLTQNISLSILTHTIFDDR